jgi:hypothetical protein
VVKTTSLLLIHGCDIQSYFQSLAPYIPAYICKKKYHYFLADAIRRELCNLIEIWIAGENTANVKR